jgi:hypothetical protein
MTVTITQDFFGVYKQVLSPDFCAAAIERFENDPRKLRGMVGDHQHRPEVKDCEEIDLTTAGAGWEDVVSIVSSSLYRYLEMYMKKWSRAFRSVEITHEGFRMTKFAAGQQYNWHSDNIGGSPTRVITAQWYLNTVEGAGTTQFLWMNRNIKPVQGQLVFWPVGWPFFLREEAPVNDSKYTIMTQLHQRLVQPQAGSQAE